MGDTTVSASDVYKRQVPIGIAMAVWEVLFVLFYGVRKVIPSEMYNEAMDYCEWKNGYRTEAMTTVAKGLAEKLSSLVSGLISLQLKKMIGYDITAYSRGHAQSDKTKFGLFAMFTIVPSITTALGIIPMFFYDLSGEKRERMYAELLVRRASLSRQATAGDAETLQKVAKEQMSVSERTREEHKRQKEEKKNKK